MATAASEPSNVQYHTKETPNSDLGPEDMIASTCGEESFESKQNSVVRFQNGDTVVSESDIKDSDNEESEQQQVVVCEDNNIKAKVPNDIENKENSTDGVCDNSSEKDAVSPKIVKTMVKKQESQINPGTKPSKEIESTGVSITTSNIKQGIRSPKLNRTDESVIAREIRLQREKEEALAREREIAIQKASNALNQQQQQRQQQQRKQQQPPQPPPPPPQPPVQQQQQRPAPTKRAPQTVSIPVQTFPSLNGFTHTFETDEGEEVIYDVVSPVAPTPTETKIALELREMREREEELRFLRQRFNSKDNLINDDGIDTFNSIPTTDEGNFSEYGSEEKEVSLDGNSRMMSPEVPTQTGFSHHRTQSLDSMSSGHSSASGGNTDYYSRRRVTVKPLDDSNDYEELPAYMRTQKETPIEREIRLAREREEELRREKGLSAVNSQPPVNKQEVHHVVSSPPVLQNNTRDVQHRIATNRIQQEIQQATEREKELREIGNPQNSSDGDFKATSLTDLSDSSITSNDSKQSPKASANILQSPMNKSTPTLPSTKAQNFASPFRNTGWNASTGTISPITNGVSSPRRFAKVPGQKGLMERFLASRGRMMSISTFSPTQNVSNGSSISANTPVASQPPRIKKPEQTPSDKQPNPVSDSRPEQMRTQHRRYTTAEEKIQEELKEMKKREEELRLQRAHLFAQSQPNIFTLVDDENSSIIGEMDNSTSLRSTCSNPNLFDCDDLSSMNETDSSQEQLGTKGARKRSPLIDQWESMIQQNSDH